MYQRYAYLLSLNALSSWNIKGNMGKQDAIICIGLYPKGWSLFSVAFLLLSLSIYFNILQLHSMKLSNVHGNVSLQNHWWCITVPSIFWDGSMFICHFDKTGSISIIWNLEWISAEVATIGLLANIQYWLKDLINVAPINQVAHLLIIIILMMM